MPGRGPPPKPAHLRQRKNKTAGIAQLQSVKLSADNKVPPLPARERGEDGKLIHWHPMVVEWWASVWRSPMASEYLDADMRGGLYLLADLHQARWEVRNNPSALREVAAEIRLQEVRFGMSPIDRSRLRWEVDKAETAAERTEARRQRKAPRESKDPRSLLKVV